MKTFVLVSSDVRTIREFQESGNVFVHLNDGSTIRRIFTSADVRKAQVLRARFGQRRFVEFVVYLINHRYRVLPPVAGRFYGRKWFETSTLR